MLYSDLERAAMNLSKRVFLEKYNTSSFIVQQKAAVLLWAHFILLPVVAGYLIINILRNNPRELAGIIIIDLIFLAVLAVGVLLIRKGKYHTVVNMDIAIVTVLTILGHLVKRFVQIETGANNFSVLMFAVMVYTAMFGTRRTLIAVSLMFLVLTVSLYLFASQFAQPSVQFHLLSGALNNVIVLIMVLCLSYQNGIITDRALNITQQELEKNEELNRTLEQKVEERTAKLKESIAQIKVLSGLLPICASCKKIRDDQGYWKQIESYIRDHSEAKFSHGICPDCAKELYPEEYADLFPEKDNRR